MKNFKGYQDKKGYLIQKSKTKQNMIDSNFLTTNAIFQKAVIGDTEWLNGNGLSYMAHQARIDYRESEGVIRRYYENFGKLIGSESAETRIYTNPDHVSRDNSMGYLMMCGHFGFKSDVRAFLWNTIKRGSFFQNRITVKGEEKTLPDLCGPENYAVLLRAALPKWALVLLYPLLLVLDSFLLLSYVWHVIQSRFDATHTSTVLHMLSGLLLCRTTIQTPFSKLAEIIFLNCRSHVREFEDKEPVVSAVKYYSRKSYDPPMEQLVGRVVEWMRK
jgi:hypothetical protein